MRSRGTGTPIRSRDDKAKATMQKCYESETEKYHASETASVPRTSSLPSPPYRATGMYGTSRYGTDQSMLLQKSEHFTTEVLADQKMMKTWTMLAKEMWISGSICSWITNKKIMLYTILQMNTIMTRRMLQMSSKCRAELTKRAAGMG